MKSFRFWSFICSLLLVFFLAACGSGAPVLADEPADALPSPAPTPEPCREIVLTGESAEEITALMTQQSLRYVDGTASAYYEELLRLSEALPDCKIDWMVDLGGTAVYNTETDVVLTASELDAQTLSDRLAYLPMLESLDICALDYSNEDAISILERYPELDLVWRVHFGRFAVRSDITCFSTLYGNMGDGKRYNDAELAPLLTYCTDLVALDLGHNHVRDLTPIGKLTKLKVLILGDTQWVEDISPLGNLTELEYLEFFLNDQVKDFSCLSKLTNMVDLNLSFCPHLHELDFLDDMPKLQMGWFVKSGVPALIQKEAREKYPQVQMQFWSERDTSTGNGWRATERNIAIRKAFLNWEQVVDFRAWNDVDYREDAELLETFASYR